MDYLMLGAWIAAVLAGFGLGYGTRVYQDTREQRRNVGRWTYSHRFEAAGKNNERLLYALRDILDEQNGPPLISREKQWQKAHDGGYALLRELENEGGGEKWPG